MNPYFQNSTGTLYCGDALETLRQLPDESVQCCVTSPPYWGLRTYGVDGQIGLEDTPEAHIVRLVEVFGEVKRVLKHDGTLWVNYGDTYLCQQGKGFNGNLRLSPENKAIKVKRPLPPKNLLGLPWRLAFALQADGWYLRSDIIWHKPNPMPESVTDRPIKAHEYLFLLSKSAKYYYDHEAVREPAVGASDAPRNRWDTKDYIVPGQKPQKRLGRKRNDVFGGKKYIGIHHGNPGIYTGGATRNLRSVWTISTFSFPGAHFATFPPKLIKPCILAGSRPDDVICDPFLGSGTTAMVARQLGRRWLGIELNPTYCDMALQRIGVDLPYLLDAAG
jgi:DNA modification methylase